MSRRHMASREGRPPGRASLACKRCRQRKVKCSGAWPSCHACIKRSEACTYDGITSSPPTAPTTPQDDREELPSKDVIIAAVDVFFDLYGEFPFWFFRKHAFLEDVHAGSVSRSLQLCMLSLVARFVEPCYHGYGGTVEASVHFASAARKKMMTTHDELTLDNIHCNLILSLYEVGHGNEQRAWLQLGTAGRLCQALGLLYETADRDEDDVVIETKRRTMWSWFVLERLLTNGRDRPLITLEPRITTPLPTSLADFTVGRASSMIILGDAPTRNDSLPAMLVRIIDIMSRIASWGGSGIGGRHEDPRPPWLEDMPFSRLQAEMQEWHDALPAYVTFSRPNIKSHLAGGEGKIFGLMHLFYMTAGTRLHRKYLPFIPPAFYDPAEGPCDGPGLTENPAFHEFWSTSTRKGVIFAAEITHAVDSLRKYGIDPSILPFAGIALLASSSFHVFCALTNWESCQDFVGEPAQNLLAYNLRSLIDMQESWPVAAFWIKSLRLFYERVSLAQTFDPDANESELPPPQLVKEAMLHFYRSDREKEGLPSHIPAPEHDMFQLLERELPPLP